MLYILDTNILINSYRTTHPFDIHPSFWQKMSEILNRKDVISIDKVRDEIYDHKDALTAWCKLNTKSSFWNNSSQSIIEYANIQNWAQSKNYNERALSEFANSKNADPFLVSYAIFLKETKDKKATIVTLEVSNPDSIKIVKLPDVCNYFGIRYINLNDFFREISVSF